MLGKRFKAKLLDYFLSPRRSVEASRCGFIKHLNLTWGEQQSVKHFVKMIAMMI
jgi:hypothetical protein